jgi:hypothetical protein
MYQIVGRSTTAPVRWAFLRRWLAAMGGRPSAAAHPEPGNSRAPVFAFCAAPCFD